MAECSTSHILILQDLKTDDNTIRTAVGLCLGATFCLPHARHNFGIEVDYLGVLGLTCKKNEARRSWHGAFSGIVHRALRLTSRLEPAGICCFDGKHND